MNIEVGEYIRTKQGTIGKAIEKYEKYCVIANTRGEIDVPYENIVNHSKNIIDLIEVGDYVNGNRIDKFEIVTNNITNNKAIKEFSDIDGRHIIHDFGIKSIVTKEQFSNMEFKL